MNDRTVINSRPRSTSPAEGLPPRKKGSVVSKIRTALPPDIHVAEVLGFVAVPTVTGIP